MKEEKKPYATMHISTQVRLALCTNLLLDETCTMHSVILFCHIHNSSQGYWVHLLNFSSYLIGCLTHVWSIKYRLITKLNAQIETTL
jgi:hypothetical protein